MKKSSLFSLILVAATLFQAPTIAASEINSYTVHTSQEPFKFILGLMESAFEEGKCEPGKTLLASDLDETAFDAEIEELHNSALYLNKIQDLGVSTVAITARDMLHFTSPAEVAKAVKDYTAKAKTFDAAMRVAKAALSATSSSYGHQKLFERRWTPPWDSGVMQRLYKCFNMAQRNMRTAGIHLDPARGLKLFETEQCFFDESGKPGSNGFFEADRFEQYYGDGIIMASSNIKGPALIHFLEKKKLAAYFECLFVIDDQQRNINSFTSTFQNTDGWRLYAVKIDGR